MTETEDVEVTVMKETDKAYLLKNNKTGDQSYFPKSEMHFKSRNIANGMGVACIPLWLLEKNIW